MPRQKLFPSHKSLSIYHEKNIRSHFAPEITKFSSYDPATNIPMSLTVDISKDSILDTEMNVLTLLALDI